MTGPRILCTPDAGSGAGTARLWLAGSLSLLTLAFLGLCLGVAPLPPWAMLDLLTGNPDPYVRAVVLELRLPRVIMAAHAGAVLALGGLAFQAVLRNPLSEPYILGVSTGAAVGSLLGTLLGAGGGPIPAFLGGLAVLACILALGARRDATHLLLTGVMCNAFGGAVVLLLLSLASPADMSAIMFWFMGNLGNCDLAQAGWHTLAFLPAYALLLLLGHPMNLLLLGDDAARSLGLPVRAARTLLVGLPSLLVSALVAAVGPLGFVGLVVPQALRLCLGHDHRRLLPGCLLFGAAFVVTCDLLTRLLPAQSDVPSGVITALVGAPVFIVLLRRYT